MILLVTLSGSLSLLFTMHAPNNTADHLVLRTGDSVPSRSSQTPGSAHESPTANVLHPNNPNTHSTIGQFTRGELFRPFPNLTAFRVGVHKTDSSGYILNLYYHGQQQAGLRAIIAQQCWVHSFGLEMKIVEPFSNHSHLMQNVFAWSHALQHDRKGVRFSSFHDIDHFNEVSMKDGDPPLVSIEGFFQKAPREVILLQINKAFMRHCLTYPVEGCVSSRNTTAFIKFTSDCPTMNVTIPALKSLLELGFKIVRTVCLNCESLLPGDAGISPDEITKYIFGPYKSSDVTLLVDAWQFGVNLTPECNRSAVCRPMDEAQKKRLIPSNQLENDVEHYIKHALKANESHGTIAFMIRLEWAMISYRTSVLKRLTQCFDEALKLQISNRKPLLALDIGKYGSASFPRTLQRYDATQANFPQIMEKLEQFVQKLFQEHTGWTLSTWEDSFTNVLLHEEASEAGYIAALQSALASRADCLVLMGGGHYQQALVVEYAKRHSHKCVHFLCTSPNWMHAFNTILGSNY